MAAAAKGQGRGQPSASPPPRRNVPLRLDEDYDFRLVRRMREVLGEGEAIAPFVELQPAGGSPVRFNALMLCLMSARYRREGSACLQHIALEAREVVEGTLDKLRDLVHLGSADFGVSPKQLYDACFLADRLEMPECKSVLHAALAMRGPGGRVALEVVHDKAAAEQLRDLYRAYPAEVPRGRFDTILSLEGAASPCMQAHRLVLVAASDFFRGLLRHRAPDDPDQPWRVELANISEAIVREAVSLIYLGEAAVPRDHFPAFALQADGWQMPLASEACSAALFGDASLSELLLDEAAALPEHLTVAVAYSHPNVLGRQDDVDRFAMLVTSPSLATHLSLAFARGWMDDFDLRHGGDWRWGPLMNIPAAVANGVLEGRTKGQFKLSKGFGKAAHRYPQEPVGTQLERFIDGPGFRTFLAHRASLQLPAWSVAMIVESLFIRLSDCNPQHPLFSPPYHSAGKGRDGKGFWWAPADWAETRPEVASWLLAWAAHQQEVAGDSPTQALLRVRGAMWHRRGAINGEGDFRFFWLDVFRRVLRLDGPTFERLLLDSDEHFAQGRAFPKGRGKGTRRENEGVVREWAVRHTCYEAVFLNAAEDLRAPLPAAGPAAFVGALGWPLPSLSAATLLRVLASDKAPWAAESVQRVLRLWLRGEAPGTQGSEERLAALKEAVVGLPDLLKYPWPASRNQPANLRYIRPRAHLDLLEHLALAHLETMCRGEEGSAAEEEEHAAPASGGAA